MLVDLQKNRGKQALLLLTDHPPKSYTPSGERIFHAAMASGKVFDSAIVLSMRGERKKEARRQLERSNPKVSLEAVNFVRGMLYPLADIVDPIKLLVFLAHGLILSRRYRPSFIIASMPPSETGFSAWFLSKCSSAKLIIDLRDDWESAVGAQLRQFFPKPMFNVLAAITNRVYSSAFVIFAATQTLANTVRKRGVATQMILVPNGADTAVFIPKSETVRSSIRERYDLPKDKVVAVYCGSGTILYYRLDKVLESIRLLSQEEKEKICVVFYVYNGLEKLKLMQNELGISGDVLDIRGPLPRKDLAEVLSSSDVGLLPFDDEAYLLCARSTKLYEYLSSGLYVISSGPKGGELDKLFMNNPKLGMFICPIAGDFGLSMSHVLRKGQHLFNDSLRKSRHSFIRENYDRKTIMETAMQALLESMQRGNISNCAENCETDSQVQKTT